ncbi:GNAT family N-acetyltransferase [Coraliomargarita sp. W4R72]
MSVTIRKAKKSDVEVVARLLMELFGQEAEFVPDFDTQARGVRQIVDNPASGQIFVIEREAKVVGALSLLWTISTAMGGQVALLEDFIIDPEFRGQGLGTLFLNEVLKRARACGCLRVILLTDGDNLKAQAIYRKAGFVGSEMKPMRLVF